MMSRTLLTAALGLVMVCTTTASANLLVNPGFEADAVFGAAPTPGAAGWAMLGNVNTASDNLDPVRTGIGSLQLVSTGGFTIPQADQSFPVSPGQTVNLQGYHLTQTALPANATFQLFKIVFLDAGGNDLPISADDVLIGQLGPVDNPGVESLPFLNTNSPVGVWNFSQAQGIAPAGSVTVRLFGGLFVDQSAGTVYVDDMVGTIGIPEPTTFVLAVLGLLSLLGFTRRRNRSSSE